MEKIEKIEKELREIEIKENSILESFNSEKIDEERYNKLSTLLKNKREDLESELDLMLLDSNIEKASKQKTEEEIEKFKILQSLSEMEHVEQEENQPFKPNFESLTETGQLTDDTYMFYDYKRETYIYFNKKTKEREIFNLRSASNKLFEVFQKAGYTIKNPMSDLKFVKKVFVVFDLEKPQFWESGLGTMYNEFNEDITKLGVIKKTREEFKNEYGDNYKDLLYKDASQLKNIAPKIHALLMNLMQEDENAVSHFLNWISSFCNTRQKIRTAFMFASIEGSGKGVLNDQILSYIFGNDYQVSVMANSLKKDFNESLENKLVVNFNEVSSDFSKADEATQNLKSLITDDYFTLNRKHISAIQVRNTFLVILSQNNLHAVKMSQSDRRFNYFVPRRTLKSVAQEDFNIEKVGVFIREMKEELDDFVKYLALYDYDKYEAEELYETVEKRRSQLATSSPSEILFKEVLDRNYETIEEYFLSIKESYFENEDKNKYSIEYGEICFKAEEILKSIKKGFEKYFISYKDLNALYSIFVDDTSKMSDRLIKKIFDSNFERVKKPVYTNGKTTRNAYDLAPFMKAKEETETQEVVDKKSEEELIEEIGF